MSKALILIDIQEDYFEGGACELVNPIQASLEAKKLLECFRKNDLPIFHIQHINVVQPHVNYLLPNTYGINIHKNVQPLSSEKIIEKNFPNSFLQTNLENELDKLNIKDVVICGMMSHMCVDATTRAAFDFGFSCTLAHNACTTKNIEFNDNVILQKDVHHSFMSALSTIYAQVQTVDDIISEFRL